MNFRIQVFDLDGRFISSFGSHGDGSGDFAQPKGVGIDAEGHVYVVDALFNRVQIFDEQGVLLLVFGGDGGAPGEFWLPSGLQIAGDRIYVADSYNRRVQIFQFLGGA
jgi:DNA-binding beta-propeller fold protein YncE